MPDAVATQENIIGKFFDMYIGQMYGNFVTALFNIYLSIYLHAT